MAVLAATLSLPRLFPITSRQPQINPTQPKDLCFKLAHQFHLKPASLPLTAIALPFLFCPQGAAAAGGDFGILEWRSLALIHPITMSVLFLLTLYAGYLGLQWRRVRTTQDEINELKKQVKKSADGDQTPAQPSPVEYKIEQLTEQRKELIKGSYKDKHFLVGSILLGFGVTDAVYGAVNTWFRTGKLFPGPHLFTGASTKLGY